MPRVIFKCPYLKGGGKTARQRENHVRYIATRPGTERMDDTKKLLPDTWRQKKLIAEILCDFPDSAEMFEYDDYLANSTRENATEFIMAALDQNLQMVSRRENYVDYIANRPRAEKVGTHGLFTAAGVPVVLSQVMDEAAAHPGNLWLPIISLRREDAARLGYDSAAAWQAFLSSYAVDMAKGLKIQPEHFRWYAAYHNEGHHPHIHMVCWSANPRAGFLTKDGIRQIKSGIAARIFRQELTEIYQRQTEYRQALSEQAQAEMEALIGQMQTGVLRNEKIETLTARLAERLCFHSGKKQYGYLQAPLKAIVDEIADELAKDGRVAECYRLWREARLEVLRTYTQNPPDPGPLSQQSELKRIRNIIIEEAAKLGRGDFTFEYEETDAGLDIDMQEPEELAAPEAAASKLFADGTLTEKNIPAALRWFVQAAAQGNQYAQYAIGKLYLMDKDIPRGREQARHWLALSAAQGNIYAQFFLDHFDSFQDPSLFMMATRLLRHMGNTFRDNPPNPPAASHADRKLRQKMREKKHAQGHAPDDHEQQLI